jgi:hypothetical protein
MKQIKILLLLLLLFLLFSMKTHVRLKILFTKKQVVAKLQIIIFEL